jgi:Domain of unknown function (DUF397)
MDTMSGAPWRKSSYSSGNGTNCVEVTTWRKASYSGGSGTNCVEAAFAEAGRVLVRDTTDRDGALLTIPADAWARFTDSLR